MHLNSASLQQRNCVKNLSSGSSDDEIQIISIVKTSKNVLSAKKVPCVDLTNDTYDDADLIQKTQLKTTESSRKLRTVNEFIEKIKTENLNSKSCAEIPVAIPAEIRQLSIPEKQNYLFSFNKSNDYNSEFNSSKIKTNSSASNFFKGTYKNEDSVKRITSNPFIENDKYVEEYFKHPFPPSLVFHDRMEKVGNKMYSRIHPKPWNLTIEEVYSRLKHAENTQHGKQHGDVIEIEKYPVSLSETECYHRILGVAPSHRLLSKCYLPPQTLNTNIKSAFKTSKGRGDQKKFDYKDKNPIVSTINYLLQGMAETNMMSTNFNANNDSSLFERDCPSADAKNNFGSCISSVTNNFFTSNKDIKDYIASNSLTELKGKIVNNSLPSLSDNYTPVESYLTPKVKTDESQPSLNINKVYNAIDLPATELRKILETAGSLHSDNVNYENGIWKNKKAFKYNHTQSYPVLDVDSKRNNEVKSGDSGLTEMYKNNKMQTENETSDDEYVDTEPIYYKSDSEIDDSCSHEDETEQPITIQQHKSKREKIRERKSHLKVNKAFLNDSSCRKPQKRKNNILDEEILESTSKESKQSKEKKRTMLQKIKSKISSRSNKSKESKSKGKSYICVEKQNKSSKISENTEKEKSKTIESKDAKKELVSVKENEKSGDAYDLFETDKLEKSSSIKKSVINSKSGDNNKSQCFYGNRVTNRGIFLTETSSSALLKKIKTPKGKKTKVIKTSVNVRSEEFHSMIKSPAINIDSSSVSAINQKFPLLSTPSSISSQLPSESFQVNVDSSASLLHNIIPVFQNDSNPFSEGEYSALPFSEHMNATWCSNRFSSLYEGNDPPVEQNVNFQSNLAIDCQMATNPAVGNIYVAGSVNPQRAALGMQPNMPVESANTSFRNNSSSGSLNSQRAAIRMHSVSNTKNSLHPTHESGSQILNSPPCSTPASSAAQISRSASCLVPEQLKSLIGHKTIKTDNVRLLMLEWDADWLDHQQNMHDPPQISEALRKVVSSYDSFIDYYNTYFPLMLLETWERICVTWTQLNQTAPYLCQISSYSVKNHYVSVECQTVFNPHARPKGISPREGSILAVQYSTKSNEYMIKILGYVTQVETRAFNPVTDCKMFSSPSVQKNTNLDARKVLTLTFMGAYDSEDIDKLKPVHIHVLCTVKHTLKQNDAMLYINESPLKKSILNPVEEGLLTFALTPRNSSEEEVDECVRDITKRISSPHPLPLFAVVRTTPESDRLNIIPLMIQQMKSTYKTKVLLCVRTVRTLGDIASNICLQQSLKLVIINRRSDTNPQFRKYLLDELVSSKRKKETSREKTHSENQKFIRKQILKDCDVVLSLIRNSHDEFMGETFLKTESIAQTWCCIVDEANSCTEPETLIPILHGISKLILIGDADSSARVLSKTASSYDYNKSFFQRAYDFMDLITE